MNNPHQTEHYWQPELENANDKIDQCILKIKEADTAIEWLVDASENEREKPIVTELLVDIKTVKDFLNDIEYNLNSI